MFLLLLLLLVIAFAVHFALSTNRSSERAGELGMLYLLVGYCGVPMLALSVMSLINPGWGARMLGVREGNPFEIFFGFAYLGMSLLSLFALKLRGIFLIAPVTMWAVFFAGATYIHLTQFGAHSHTSHGTVLVVFATHGLISLLLVVSLLISRVWRTSVV